MAKNQNRGNLNVAPEAADGFAKLHPKAVDALGKNLAPGEPVLAVINGASNQAIVGTPVRAFVYKKGFMAGASFGSELTTWDYRNLVGVQVHTGMMSGAVILQAPGQAGTRTNSWKDGDGDPYKAPNAVPLVRPWAPAEQGAALLRSLISSAHQPAPSAVQPQRSEASGSAGSVADELQKLAALRKDGILTEEEFQEQKRRILG